VHQGSLPALAHEFTLGHFVISALVVHSSMMKDGFENISYKPRQAHSGGIENSIGSNLLNLEVMVQ
jgi:hypothetical protein